ncbi:MAG: molybdopterin dinucleotide-binding protein [Candidatus Bathyarchaeota archaeon]|nr:molybdopterin dinucleotide-binding protein [Candidatus Bathyarchaeota archaeon]MCX8176843.1 molybdopterin dinucleotide-binding protein [Candidatus Bathyarchaeota archaeon]MDW8193473.1 molybdopterin dinucleotide binding domain-containing protein [Nitrososphaerota archaeon]
MDKKPKLKVTLVTGRTIEQGAGKEYGKFSRKYGESVSTCYMDPEDMKKLAIRDRTNILVSTKYGSVVVKAAKSSRAPHPGIIYIPYGPWVNVLVDPETNSIGMPTLKGIPAEVEPAPDKPILSLEELLKQQFRKD